MNEEKFIIIKKESELHQLVDYIKDKDYLSFDTETTGTEKEDKIIGYSLSGDIDIGFYVVLMYWNLQTQKLEDTGLKEASYRIIESLKSKNLIMHNAVFDCFMVENNFNVSLIDSVHTDTMLLAHILDENRSAGLKELGTSLFGQDARKEQEAMKASVTHNGGVLTKDKYELYKADADLLAQYGAKDSILTMKLFYTLVPQLFDQNLDSFFYEDETMPLLRGPTYNMNTEGMRVDPDKLQMLKKNLEVECMEAKAFIYREIAPFIATKYPGTSKTNTFNIGSSKQLAWLLFIELENDFSVLTSVGKEICKALNLPIPYSMGAKADFIRFCSESKGMEYQPEGWDVKKQKKIRAKKIGDVWNYLACGKDTLKKLEKKYEWVKKLLEYSKNMKLLNTYVEGIQTRMKYNIIRPSFLQHGTTSGRYSSRKPNFQNLPRDDKRIKSCIVSRPKKVFIGADYSQLEPRVFASLSGDVRLLECFKNGEDFYSVIGAEVFGKNDCSLKKDNEGSFAKKHPNLRHIAKVIALSATYGTTPPKMAPAIGKSIEESRYIINDYFENFPSVRQMMLDSHEQAKKRGYVTNLYGRPRRMPKAKQIPELFGDVPHEELEYEYRNILNLAVNHRIQSTGASIMNRAAVSVYNRCKELSEKNELWSEVKIVLQVHDELILEGPESIAEDISEVLKDCMENTVLLPGVNLVAEPKIANNLADLK